MADDETIKHMKDNDLMNPHVAVLLRTIETTQRSTAAIVKAAKELGVTWNMSEAKKTLWTLCDLKKPLVKCSKTKPQLVRWVLSGFITYCLRARTCLRIHAWLPVRVCN